MQPDEGEIRSQARKRLAAMLQAAVGGVIVAAATLSTPSPEASATPATQKPALEERVKEVRDRKAKDLPNPADGSCDDDRHHHHWGNHWDKWHNWNNWHNWHNW
jgi:hypothetical protein